MSKYSGNMSSSRLCCKSSEYATDLQQSLEDILPGWYWIDIKEKIKNVVLYISLFDVSELLYKYIKTTKAKILLKILYTHV